MKHNCANRTIKAVHLRVESSDVTDKLIQYMQEGLAPLGIDTLIIEFNPGYHFKCFPELANGSFGRADALKVSAAARKAGIRIIPLFMCLGHQGWRFRKNTLLTAYPEFDETPGVPEDGDAEHTPDLEFYCHSWCASNDGVYQYVFPMMDEIMADFDAECIHVGMDEVFSLADDNCPRCKGKDRAELFSRTVRILHDHIVREKGWQMMMWADRLNNAEAFGYHAWEGDTFGTWRALDTIPTDILLADWHYEMNPKGFAGIRAFIDKGFTVIPAAWRQLQQTRFLWDEAVHHSNAAGANAAGRLGGMIITCWQAVTVTLLDELLSGLKNDIQDEGDKGIGGIASSIVYMTKKLAQMEE